MYNFVSAETIKSLLLVNYCGSISITVVLISVILVIDYNIEKSQFQQCLNT